MTFYAVPPIWRGYTCAILASGPSMTPAVADAVWRARIPTIAVNNQGVPTRLADGRTVPALAPWADVLYAADERWWREHPEASDFKGSRVTIAGNGHDTWDPPPGVLAMGNGGEHGLDDRPTHLRTGCNGGYQAMHLAVHFGAARILLCGFDMHAKRGEHWFGDHHWRPYHQSLYGAFIREFIGVAPELERRGIEIINCTPGSALICFPMMALDEALALENLRCRPAASATG